MSLAKITLLGILLAVLTVPVWGQTPPYLQPGTYNAPAGAGAHSPANPSAPFSLPRQPSGPVAPTLPLSVLNRDILNPSQAIWLQQLQRTVGPMPRPSDAGKVVIKVKLPMADAQLWVNDQPTRQKGLERVFVTPPLEPGKYRYRFRASWVANKTLVRSEQTLIFQPGEDLVIDLSKKP